MRPVVVEVVQELEPGGIQVMVLELERLLAGDVEVHVVSLENTIERLTALWPRVSSVGPRLHALAKPPGRDFSTVLTLARLLHRIGATAVHTHHIGPLLYGGLAARLAGVRRLVHTEHDAWHLQSRRRRTLQTAALALLRPHLIADAAMVASALVAAIPSSRPIIIANGIDTTRFRPGNQLAARRVLGLPLATQLIGSAGRLEPVKGHKLLIDAIARLPDTFELAIAGDGSMRAALQEHAIALGVDERCHFLGHTDNMEAFYQSLDVFCLPSEAEGLPLALLEAQSCGIPAVATDVGAVREVLAPDVSIAVEPGNAEALAAGLVRAFERRNHATLRPFIIDGYDAGAMAAAYRAVLAA
ncbi:MAG: glycosyltransferase [Rhodospirillales bacterium]|nr:glycosyltransferase [Rhodospirillales bacterium]